MRGTPRVLGRGQHGDIARLVAAGFAAVSCLALANCASSDKFARRVDPRYGVASSERVIEPGQPIPKGGGTYRIGRPYTVAGRMYYPEENRNYRAEGIASWYGDDFHGRLTANGEIYDLNGISAAHPTLPMPSYVRVTNLANHRSLIVRVNDRGPYAGNRVIDLSSKAADLLGFRAHGLARVRVEYVGPAPLEGSDDRMLLATLRQGTPAPAPSSVMVAAAQPFIPTMDRYPTRVSGPAPLPRGRPYDLGDEPPVRSAAAERPPARSAPRPATTEVAAASAPSFSPYFSATPMNENPVSAYAPAAFDGTANLTMGRGLY
jgi:rare lipoprotein A